MNYRIKYHPGVYANWELLERPWWWPFWYNIGWASSKLKAEMHLQIRKENP